MAAALTKIVPSVASINSVHKTAKNRRTYWLYRRAQVLGNGVDAGHPEERHKQEGSHQHGKAAADEIKVHHDRTVAVGIGRYADHVLGPDIRHDQRHGHRPPRQRFTGQEKVLAGLHSSAHPQAQSHDSQQVDHYQHTVQHSQFGRVHVVAVSWFQGRSMFH
jgi:hypothetical protein